MSVTITVTPSFDKVGNAFKDMKLGVAMQKGIERWGFEIEGASKKVTPVDTGRLRASISTKVSTLKAVIAPNTHYAYFVHEGHRQTPGRYVPAIGKRLVRSWVPGKPYMSIGLEATKLKHMAEKDPVFEELSKYIDAELRKI